MVWTQYRCIYWVERGAGCAPCRLARAARAGKWAVEITAALSWEMGWMERKARRAQHVSRLGFPVTNRERQLSLPAPADTKSPYTTKAKSAFLFVWVSWGLGQHLHQNSNSSPRWNLEVRGADRYKLSPKSKDHIKNTQKLTPHPYCFFLYKTQFEN